MRDHLSSAARGFRPPRLTSMALSHTPAFNSSAGFLLTIMSKMANLPVKTCNGYGVWSVSKVHKW